MEKNQTVEQLKKRYGNVSSNFLFGIDDPPDHQCPDLNDMQSKITESFNHLKKQLGKNNQCDAAIVPVLATLKDLLDDIEDRRTAFENIREVMDNWKDLAKKAMGKNANDFLNIDYES
jgi:hypothetical protein